MNIIYRVLLPVITGILLWISYLLFREVNGPKNLRPYEMKQAVLMMNQIINAVRDYREVNNGQLPKSPLEIVSYIGAVDPIIPISARVRLKIDEVSFWKTPELIDVFGMWTVIGDQKSTAFLVLMNPNFFGPRNIVVAEASDTTSIEVIEIDELESLIHKFKGAQ